MNRQQSPDLVPSQPIQDTDGSPVGLSQHPVQGAGPIAPSSSPSAAAAAAAAHPQQRPQSGATDHRHQSSSQSQSPSPMVSPPNQPRWSLSAQLAPDYHNWVSDVSTTPSSSNGQPPSSRTGNRFLDAVTGRSKAQQGRIRRENQPSFTGSAFTNSDNEAGRDQDDADDSIDNDGNHNNPSTENTDGNGRIVADNPRDSTSNAPESRLPPLNKSRIQVPDSSRPAFKLGAPIVSKPQSQNYHAPSTKGTEQISEISALLGNNRTQDQHADGQHRWTNEGSRRKTPRYNGPPEPSEVDELDDGMQDTSERDSPRWPSR
ncbi:hypothetical protein BC939DRAFT_97341 [Gamsiella multidivaricata]|uniref:uncharacterized protein n=1 Tax=Gamsiella multidivaricata TaxID=101098 RepID=UPI00221F3D8F|nr:uncharacterized protein BC939DRAFT_97341 [Gamsiella multidivaricata]KAI7832187.1 hypothetical protein BC939DRAFT_97341 [Gamsiella multidivaricata]